MTWPPTCSQDVAEAREAQGTVDHDPSCVNGWLDNSFVDADHPRPCPDCKSHIFKTWRCA